jgi:thiol-disulfide isomerase/thioredoxin
MQQQIYQKIVLFECHFIKKKIAGHNFLDLFYKSKNPDMNIIEKFKEKWSKKSVFSKILDILFYLLIISLIIPASRIEVLGFVNRIRAEIVQPSTEDPKDAKTLTDADFQWNLYKSDGTTMSFSEMRGKVIFLNFWATWCPPCVGEMPGIETLYQKFKNNQNVVFCMVTSDEKQKVAEFIARKNYSFPVYFASENIPQKLSSSSIPSTFLVSKTGKIMIQEVGASNWGGEKMEKIVNDLCR